MPNTPKKQIKQKLSCDFDDGPSKSTLTPTFNSNLKKFASNNSISGSQTLKTLPEINALQDFSDCPNPEPPKMRAKGLLERRGSNASLTIDLGSTHNIAEVKPVPLNRLNTAKSVSNLYLSSMSGDKCSCLKKYTSEATKVKTFDSCISVSHTIWFIDKFWTTKVTGGLRQLYDLRIWTENEHVQIALPKSKTLPWLCQIQTKILVQRKPVRAVRVLRSRRPRWCLDSQ